MFYLFLSIFLLYFLVTSYWSNQEYWILRLVCKYPKNFTIQIYSTVTDFARFRGWSIIWEQVSIIFSMICCCCIFISLAICH
jgi:hypothetical protein